MKLAALLILVLGLAVVFGCGCAKADKLVRLKTSHVPCPKGNPNIMIDRKVAGTDGIKKEDWLWTYTNYNMPFTENPPTPLPVVAGFTPYLHRMHRRTH
jgi:hypothetical protein